MNLPASISFGEISVECPTEEDPTKMCTGPVPFRTIVAIIGIVANLLVSFGTDHLFTSEKLSLDMDFFGCYKYSDSGEVVQARSRLMHHQRGEEFQMQTKNGDLKIPRPKVEPGAYK